MSSPQKSITSSSSIQSSTGENSVNGEETATASSTQEPNPVAADKTYDEYRPRKLMKYIKEVRNFDADNRFEDQIVYRERKMPSTRQPKSVANDKPDDKVKASRPETVIIVTDSGICYMCGKKFENAQDQRLRWKHDFPCKR